MRRDKPSWVVIGENEVRRSPRGQRYVTIEVQCTVCGYRRNVEPAKFRAGKVATMCLCTRFWRKVDDSGGPDACWLWIGTRFVETGYGLISYNRRPTGAHRVSYILNIGPIPEGLYVLHSCNNRPCVNPAHLRAGTPKDNVDDMIASGREVYLVGEKNHSAKLSESEVVEICRLRAIGLSLSAIADKFGISRWTVANIINGKIWRHVDCEKINPRAWVGVCRGDRHYASKIKDCDVQEIRRQIQTGGRGTMARLAKEYGVRPGTIAAIRDGKTHVIRGDCDENTGKTGNGTGEQGTEPTASVDREVDQ